MFLNYSILYNKGDRMTENSSENRGLFCAFRYANSDKTISEIYNEMKHIDIYIIGKSEFGYNQQTTLARQVEQWVRNTAPNYLLPYRIYDCEQILKDSLMFYSGLGITQESVIGECNPIILNQLINKKSIMRGLELPEEVLHNHENYAKYILSELKKQLEFQEHGQTDHSLRPFDYRGDNDNISTILHKLAKYYTDSAELDEVRNSYPIKIFYNFHPSPDPKKNPIIRKRQRNTIVILNTTFNDDYYDANFGSQNIDSLIEHQYHIVGRTFSNEDLSVPTPANVCNISDVVSLAIEAVARNYASKQIQEKLYYTMAPDYERATDDEKLFCNVDTRHPNEKS